MTFTVNSNNFSSSPFPQLLSHVIYPFFCFVLLLIGMHGWPCPIIIRWWCLLILRFCFPQCLEAVQPSTLAEAAELTDLLTRFELEGLISAHDGVAAHAALAATPAVTPTSGASTPPPSMTIVNSRPPAAVYSREDNIKIIKIEKTTEPLVCFF